MEFLDTPREGIPPLLGTASEITQAADALAAGTGPIAIDTERASGFRFGDEAYLLQLRRKGAGSFLIDPRIAPEAVEKKIGNVLNGETWILHAAESDLPSLHELGLVPGTLIDTELAGRFLGLEHASLGAMTEHYFDIALRKDHGGEDWSTRPLPEDWLQYAALDVELLIELAQAVRRDLIEQDKLDWFEQECAYIRETYADGSPRPPKTWRDVKGIYKLKGPHRLAVAKKLWEERQQRAQDTDTAPSRIMNDRSLIDLCRVLPTTERKLKGLRGLSPDVYKSADVWVETINAALEEPRESWPERPQRSPNSVPSQKNWERQDSEAWDILNDIRDEIAAIASEFGMHPAMLLRPATMRSLVWRAVHTGEITTPAELHDAAVEAQVRPWQLELVEETLEYYLFD